MQLLQEYQNTKTSPTVTILTRCLGLEPDTTLDFGEVLAGLGHLVKQLGVAALPQETAADGPPAVVVLGAVGLVGQDCRRVGLTVQRCHSCNSQTVVESGNKGGKYLVETKAVYGPALDAYSSGFK